MIQDDDLASASQQRSLLCKQYAVASFNLLVLDVVAQGSLCADPVRIAWAIGVTAGGDTDMLGVWPMMEPEAKFWSFAADDLAARGVERFTRVRIDEQFNACVFHLCASLPLHESPRSAAIDRLLLERVTSLSTLLKRAINRHGPLSDQKYGISVMAHVLANAIPGDLRDSLTSKSAASRRHRSPGASDLVKAS